MTEEVKTVVLIILPQKWDHLRASDNPKQNRISNDGDWLWPSLVVTGLKRPAVENSNSQMYLHFSYSCTIERKVLQTYKGPKGNTCCAVSLSLMNSEENYSWRPQRRINTLIGINANRIIFSPDTVSALSKFFGSFVPTFDIPRFTILLLLFPHLLFWPNFLFLNLKFFFKLESNPSFKEIFGDGTFSSLHSCYFICAVRG